MTALSVLDLSPVPDGTSEAAAVRNSVDLARHVDGLGYKRMWLAEHHGIPSVASSAPEVLIGHVAAATQHLRVGSGGMMLPNHSPLRVAEEFKVLEALHPGRIDLGIGRAPGTDQLTAYALRRSREALQADDFPEQLGELLCFGGRRAWPDDHPFKRIAVIPRDAQLPPVFLLGSSDYSAHAAAMTGLGFAYAAHINPHGADEALRSYRERFVAEVPGDRPHAILALGVVVGEDDEHAARLASSAKLALVRLRANRPTSLPSAEEAMAHEYDAQEQALLRGIERVVLHGGPETVRALIEQRVQSSGADEVMVTTHIHDHQQRKDSYTRLAHALSITPED